MGTSIHKHLNKTPLYNRVEPLDGALYRKKLTDYLCVYCLHSSEHINNAAVEPSLPNLSSTCNLGAIIMSIKVLQVIYTGSVTRGLGGFGLTH